MTMASQDDNDVATTSPGILPAEDGGALPTLPTPPLPTLDQVLPVKIQLPVWTERFVSSSPFSEPRYHKVKLKKPPIFRTYDLTPVMNDVYNLSLNCLYLKYQASTDIEEALLDDEPNGGALSVENPQEITETQGTLSEFIRTSFSHLDNQCLDNFSPLLFENSGNSNSPSPMMETDNILLETKAENVITVDSPDDTSIKEADINDVSTNQTPAAPPSTPTLFSPFPPPKPTLTIPRGTLTIPSEAPTLTISSPGLPSTPSTDLPLSSSTPTIPDPSKTLTIAKPPKQADKVLFTSQPSTPTGKSSSRKEPKLKTSCKETSPMKQRSKSAHPSVVEKDSKRKKPLSNVLPALPPTKKKKDIPTSVPMTSDEDVETITTLRKQKIALTAELKVSVAETEKLRELLSKEKTKNLEVLSNIEATSSEMHIKEVEVLRTNYTHRVQALLTSCDDRLKTSKDTSQAIIDELKIQNASLKERLKTPPPISDQEIKKKLDMAIRQHEEEKESFLLEAKKCSAMVSNLQVVIEENNEVISSLELQEANYKADLDDQSKKIIRLEKENKSLLAKKVDVEKKLSESEAANLKTKQQVDALEKEKVKLMVKIDLTKPDTNAIKTLNKALNDKDEDIKDITTRLSETREFLGEREDALRAMKLDLDETKDNLLQSSSAKNLLQENLLHSEEKIDSMTQELGAKEEMIESLRTAVQLLQEDRRLKSEEREKFNKDFPALTLPSKSFKEAVDKDKVSFHRQSFAEEDNEVNNSLSPPPGELPDLKPENDDKKEPSQSSGARKKSTDEDELKINLEENERLDDDNSAEKNAPWKEVKARNGSERSRRRNSRDRSHERRHSSKSRSRRSRSPDDRRRRDSRGDIPDAPQSEVRRFTLAQAEGDWEKLRKWFMKYRDYLYDHTAFRTFMRSRDATEEEKFQSIERLISQLFLVDNFSDFDKFLKGEKITNEDVRIRKGTIPNLRQDSVEWSFVTSFSDKAEGKKKMFINFSNFLVCIRPHCESLFAMCKTMMEADIKHTTVLFYTEDNKERAGPLYKADTNKDVDEKSDEEKKAELLLVVGLSKVYYALRQKKRVKSPPNTGLYCKNKPYTETWATEVSETLDGGVNRPCGQLMRNQYIARKEWPLKAAVTFQDEIRRARGDLPSAERFNPWQKGQ